ncbi:MAG: gas vesicle protein [Deltaproteobacteria bacterium]|nr:gas vesicle protein [Deltaproteobacteria bacterium]
MAAQARPITMSNSLGLADVVDRVLEKGVVIDADIAIFIAGTELLNIRIRAAVASFETAARYGLEFPSGVDRALSSWQGAVEAKESCPGCGKRQSAKALLEKACPWCGWVSALSKQRAQPVGGA